MKLTTALTAVVLGIALCVPLSHASSADRAEPMRNGATLNGWSLNGPILQGPVLQGIKPQGVILNGLQFNGPGLVLQGVNFNGLRLNGPGLVLQGSSAQGGVFADVARSPLSGIALDRVHVTLPKR